MDACQIHRGIERGAFAKQDAFRIALLDAGVDLFNKLDGHAVGVAGITHEGARSVVRGKGPAQTIHEESLRPAFFHIKSDPFFRVLDITGMSGITMNHATIDAAPRGTDAAVDPADEPVVINIGATLRHQSAVRHPDQQGHAFVGHSPAHGLELLD